MSYIERLVEDDLIAKMAASGAVLIKGAKSCGKTETATRYAKSVLRMDKDPQVSVIMATNPQLLLEAAENLKKFAANIDTEKMESPKSLNIITGTGMSYRRPDGINVISLASLGK